MKILVTGGTGFVGKNLIPLIKEKNSIKILSRKSKGKDFILGDLRNYESLPRITKIDCIIHLSNSKKYEENIIMMKNIIRIYKESGCKRIIFLSSMSAKRNHPDEYGKNKFKLEKIIKNSRINYTIFRPSIIYGKGSASFDFILEYLKKIPFVPIIGKGKYKINPVHILDIVKVINNSLKNKKSENKEYDLAGGEFIYFIELINKLKLEKRIKKRNVCIPIWICKFFACIFPKLISKENILNLTEDSSANIEEAKKDFNYSPIKFHEGIKNGLL